LTRVTWKVGRARVWRDCSGWKRGFLAVPRGRKEDGATGAAAIEVLGRVVLRKTPRKYLLQPRAMRDIALKTVRRPVEVALGLREQQAMASYTTQGGSYLETWRSLFAIPHFFAQELGGRHWSENN